MLKVEIDPGDNTVFISSGLTGTFFNHFDIKGTEVFKFVSYILSLYSLVVTLYLCFLNVCI